VISQRLGHATIAITMDTYGHVIPGLDELTWGGGESAEVLLRWGVGGGT
jgi:hypothetical protein